MRALLLALLSLLSLLSPCESTRDLVCRNPPLAVQPAVEEPPLEAAVEQPPLEAAAVQTAACVPSFLLFSPFSLFSLLAKARARLCALCRSPPHTAVDALGQQMSALSVASSSKPKPGDIITCSGFAKTSQSLHGCHRTNYVLDRDRDFFLTTDQHKKICPFCREYAKEKQRAKLREKAKNK